MKEKWKVGNYKSTVVSDTKQKNTNFPHLTNPIESNDSDIKYYGGYLVCESISNPKTANLIADTTEMFDIINTLENDNNSIPDWLWQRILNVRDRNNES